MIRAFVSGMYRIGTNSSHLGDLASMMNGKLLKDFECGVSYVEEADKDPLMGFRCVAVITPARNRV